MRGIWHFVIVLVQAAIIGAMLALPLAASQNPLFNPTSGTLSGLTMVQNFNNAIDSLNTCNSGGSTPANQLAGAPSNSNCWDDTSTPGWIKHKLYLGGSWVVAAYYDLTNALYTGIVGGGAINTVTAAATTDLCSVNPAFVQVAGNTTITSFGATCPIGVWKRVFFGGAPTLTYNGATLVLPTQNSINAAPGDSLDAVSYGSGIWVVTSYMRGTGAPLSTVGLSLGANALASSALPSFSQPVNLNINGSSAGFQLTVAIKGINGNDPSPINPVLVGFRSETQSAGTNIFGSITAALSFTVASTTNMGCATGATCRLWIELICQTESAGVCTSVLVGLSVQSTVTSNACYPLLENALHSTGIGTAGGNTIATIQTSVASLANKAIRIIGYMEATWTSGSGWAAPTVVQLFAPGMHKPCDSVQMAFESSGVSLAIAPTSPLNFIRFTASINCFVSAGGTTAILFKRGAGTLYTQSINSGAGLNAVAGLSVIDAPETTASTTYSMASANSPSCSLVGSETIELEEIMGALEPGALQPANDNVFSLRARRH